MEFLYKTELSIPLIQIILLLLFSTLSLLFGRVKLALVINYVFALYWGYFLNRDTVFGDTGTAPWFTPVYFGFGILIAVLVLLSFYRHSD
ncbi:MAG: hypothetical protein ACLFOY_01195 [Desulfatibacillaceae bacterium]